MLQNVTPEQTNSLSPRQTAALPHIASEPTLADGARAARIARITLNRWMREPAFRAELERIRQNIADLAFTELQAATLKAVFRVVELLNHPDPNLRLKAAKTILSTAIASRSDKDLSLRLDTIDNALSLLKNQQ